MLSCGAAFFDNGTLEKNTWRIPYCIRQFKQYSERQSSFMCHDVKTFSAFRIQWVISIPHLAIIIFSHFFCLNFSLSSCRKNSRERGRKNLSQCNLKIEKAKLNCFQIFLCCSYILSLKIHRLYAWIKLMPNAFLLLAKLTFN